MGDFRMAAEPQITFGERMIAPVTNISDFIWGGTWDGEAVIPFPPLALILLGVGLWFMIGLRFYPIVKLGSAIKGLFPGRKGAGSGEPEANETWRETVTPALGRQSPNTAQPPLFRWNSSTRPKNR